MKERVDGAKNSDVKVRQRSSRAQNPGMPRDYSAVNKILQLQQTVGNHEVQRLFRSRIVHARSGISAPGTVSNIVQRRPADDFVIRGQFQGQLDYPDRIFFDLNSAELTEFEKKRIELFFSGKADINQPITLTGLSSEEGDRSYNLALATRRANEVRKQVLRLNPKASVTLLPSRVETGVIDYRFVRAVVINEKAGGGGATPPATCDLESLRKLQTKAIDLIGTALPHLDDATFDPTVRSLFGDPLPKKDLKKHLAALKAKLGEILNAGNYECARRDDPICSAGALAYANRKTNRISFCPDSPAARQGDERERVNTMIHETLHLTPDLFTKDYAYTSDPLISYLSQAEALKNTDSYVLLIRQLALSISPPQAAFSGTTKGFKDSERDLIWGAIGWAMSSVKAAHYQVASLYKAVDLTLTTKSWPDIYEGYVDLYKRLAPIFGLRPLRDGVPGKGLGDEDKWKLAGIHDRLKTLTLTVNPDIRRYDVERKDSISSISIDFRALYATAEVNGAFPALSLDERVKKILDEIVAKGQLSAQYASAIIEIRDFMGNKWPV